MMGVRIKLLREEAGLTQSQLAEAINVGVAQIYRYENDKTDPSSHVLYLLAQLFDVSADYLLGITDSRTPSEPSRLEEREKVIIDALRSGDRYKAIQVIVSGELEDVAKSPSS